MRKKPQGQMELGDKAPPPPKVPEQAFLEYPAPDGVKWRVEHWADLRKELDLKMPDDMCRLHAILAKEERAWRIVRLLYWVAPLVGETAREFMQAHSRNEVAGLMGIDVMHFDAEIGAIRTFWKKSATMAAAAVKEEPLKIAARLSGLKDENEADQLLKAHGFGDLREVDKAYVLERIIDLTGELEESKARPIAQRAIRAELRLHSFDRMLTDLDEDYANETDSKKKGGLRKDISDITKSQKELQGEYRELMEALNLTQGQNQSLRKKAKIEVSLSGMVAAIREYESRGDTELVDGVFQAGEVSLLLRPMSIRAPQYRPDLVAVIQEAMKEENLFNPNWKPPEMNRAEYRRFRRALAAGMQALEDGEEVLDMEDDDESEGRPNSQQPVDRLDDGFSGRMPNEATPSQGGGLPPFPTRTGTGGEADFLIG